MPQERRPQKQRREEIADAALRIIAKQGITALTVASLAKALGLTGGALYRHFPSTDAILEAVAARAVAILHSSLPDPSLGPLEWLERFVEGRSRAVTGGVARIIMSEQIGKAMPQEARDVIRAAVKASFSAIESTLVAGQERGVIRRDVAAADLVPMVVGSVQVLALTHGDEPLSGVVAPSRVWPTLKVLLMPPEGVEQ